uniref:Beta-2-microglobulin n=1 Tax=Leptobrachium leishanense TaxID=445787 RepID=A0A8C5QRT9_9ANUR
MEQVPGKAESPKVYTYTEKPLEYGKENIFLCHVKDYHPPRIEVKLKKNGQEIENVKQNDPVFSNDWTYVWTNFAGVTVNEGDQLTCEVSHDLQAPKIHMFNPII